MSDEDSKPPSSQRPPGEPKQSGRVAYDAKGNPIWEWQTSTGVYDREVSTQRLKKLEADLSLEDTQPVPKSKDLSLQQEAERLPCGGMNPYDTGGKSTTPVAATHPALAHKQPTPPVNKSLVSKYAAVAKKNDQPQGIWQKLKARFKTDK